MSLAVAVVALHRQDRLHRLEEVLLLHKAQVRRLAREGLLCLMRAAHAAADDDVEAGEVDAVGLHDDDAADVVNVQVHAVVARHRERDLELLRQVGAPVQRLDLVAGDDAVAAVLDADLLQVDAYVLGADVALPVFDVLGGLAVWRTRERTAGA